MRLRRQLLVLFYISSVAAVLVGMLAVYSLLMPVFRELEEEAARRDLSRVEAAFLQSFTILYARTRDWAELPAVGSFVAGDRDQLPPPPGGDQGSLRLDQVLVFDSQGRSHQLRGTVQPEAGGLYRAFLDRDCYPFWGVTTFDRQSYIFAMEQVGQCGAVVFAVKIDTRLARELSGLTGLDVHLRPAVAAARHHEQVRTVDRETSIATFPVVDYRGRILLEGEVVLPREVFRRGLPLAGVITGILLVVALLTATLLYLFVRRRVFGRLSVLHQGVRGIAQGSALSQRVPLRAGDEFGDLARDFNAMVDHMKDVQESLARASERAEAANRAKSLFLANMSHEIRTPMTAILGYTELLENSLLSEEERRHYLSIIQQNGDALMALISDVLDLSRIEAGQLRVEHQTFDLPVLMKDVLHVHLLRAKQKGIGLYLQYLSAVPRDIISDPFRLRQVLINLVGNAVKFTDSGTVEVCVRWEEGLQPALHVEVRDTGIGIPDAALPAVFEPFSQVDDSHTRRYGGTGLGLAIARQLCRSLGGDITVSSRPGEGSVFHLHVRVLPAEDTDRVLPREALAVEGRTYKQPAIHSSGRVLVVEDNQVNRLLVMRILSNSGFAVYEAENGQEALDMVEQGTHFDLIVLDMQMPVLDGFAAARALRDMSFRGAILALTANVMLEDQRRCLDAGCDEFLGKPVRARQLLDACVRLLNRSPLSSRRA